MNGFPVVIPRVEVEDKDSEDELSEAEDEEKVVYVDEKRIRSEKDDGGKQKKKIAIKVQIPKKVISRGEPENVDMDLDKDASMGKDMGKDGNKPNKSRDKHSTKSKSLWEKLRSEADIAKVSNKILEGFFEHHIDDWGNKYGLMKEGRKVEVIEGEG